MQTGGANSRNSVGRAALTVNGVVRIDLKERTVQATDHLGEEHSV